MEGSAAAYGSDEGGTAARQAAVGGSRRETVEQHVAAGPVGEAETPLLSATWTDNFSIRIWLILESF